MCCLNFCRVYFLILLLLYLVYVFSERLLDPLCGFIHAIFGGCVVWTFVGSSSWFYSSYIWCMCCLNFCWIQFLVLLPWYLADVLSDLLLGPVPGFTPTIFGVCVVWTFVGYSTWSYSRYIWWMCCLNFCRVQFLVRLPLYSVNVLSELF